MPNSFETLGGIGRIDPSNFSGPVLSLSQGYKRLPASLGKVRIQVLLFEEGRCPFVKRIRQVHEFKFTRTMIALMKSRNLNEIELIEQGSGLGVTLARKSFGRYGCCFADGYTFSALEPSAQADAVSSGFVSQSPSQPPSLGTDQQNQAKQSFGSYQITGFNEVAASYREDNDSLFMHQLFVAAPGLFTEIMFPDQVTNFFESQGFNTGNDRSPLEDLLPITRTREIAEPVKPSESNQPGSKKKVTVESVASPGVAYVQLDTAFVGKLFDRLGDTLADLPGLRARRDAQLIGSAPGSLVPNDVPKYENLNPGMHASYEKMMSIMPGMDFSIRFHNTTGQFPIADLNRVVDNDGTVTSYRPAFLMREYYKFLDPLFVGAAANSPAAEQAASGVSESQYTEGVDSPSLSSVAAVWPNFGVAPFKVKPTTQEDNSSSFLIGADAEQFYLAEQPYVILEIDGGYENRFFITITHESTVNVFEITGDPEYVPAFINTEGGHIMVLYGGVQHSRLLGSFKARGASLLKEDAFEISVQHFFGRLKLTINGGESILVERSRWNDKVRAMASQKPLTDSALQELDQDNKAGDPQSFTPIKLSGFIRVHMGHYRGAFNFSPIRYIESTSMSTERPITAFEVVSDGKPDQGAISVLLRSKGARSDITSSADEIEQKVAVGYPGEGAPYFFQCANVLEEHIRGKNVQITSEYFSPDMRKTIPGDPAGTTSEGGLESIFIRDSSTQELMPSKISISVLSQSKEGNESALDITPTITLNSGSIRLRGGQKEFVLEHVIRPLCSGFTVFIREDESDRWTTEPIDITHHVISFEDNWQRQERSQINHSASLNLYLTKGEASGNLESITPATGRANSPQYDFGFEASASDTDYSRTDHSDYLASLQDKYFYITVYAWRENAGDFNGTMFSDLGTGKQARRRTAMFTGICNDVSFRTDVNKVIMTCQLRDYSMVFEHLRWLNAPYYDAVRDYNMMLDVVAQAGFKMGRTSVDNEGGSSETRGEDLLAPGRLIYELSRIPPVSDYQVLRYGDENIIWNDVVLPGKYNTLNEAMFKPTAGESYFNIMQKVARLVSKTLFFDALGVLHFDIPVDEAEMQMVSKATQDKQGFPEIKPVDYFSWTVNDEGLSRADVTQRSTEIFSEEPDDISRTNPSSQITNRDISYNNFRSGSGGSSVNYKWWNVVSGTSYNFKRLTKDVVNEIRIISSTPNMQKLIVAHWNRASIVDPSSPSFIGYKKMFYQQEGVFGSKDTLKQQANRYTKMFNAPVEIQFSVPGRTGLRPMQVIEFNGFGMAGPIRLLVGEVRNSLQAEQNLWETTISGIYFIPGEIAFTTSDWKHNSQTGGVTDGSGNRV